MLTHPSDADSPRPNLRKSRVGLTFYQEDRLKRKLRRRTCSEPWVEAQIKTCCDADENGSPIVYRYHDPHVYPPGGAKTAMIRCPACGAFNPPNTIEHGRCLDHADHRGWGPSPSAVAIQALQRFNFRMEQPELPPEDLKSLRKEIRRYKFGEKRKSRSRHKSLFIKAPNL